MATVLKQVETRKRINSPPRTGEGRLVKSAGRVLQVLEFFDDIRRPATATEIALFFRFPQSSTSQLLRSMLSLGYLQYDRETRLYSPSARVSLLGSWCDSRFVGEGQILRMMNRLNEQTGRAVFLASQVGSYAQYIHIVQAPDITKPHVTLGMSRPLSTSGAGLALMSTMSDHEVTRIVMRNNAERNMDDPAVSVRQILETVGVARQRGYIYSINPELGGGVIAAPLPNQKGQSRLALCLGDYTAGLETDREYLISLFMEELGGFNASQENDRGFSLAQWN